MLSYLSRDLVILAVLCCGLRAADEAAKRFVVTAFGAVADAKTIMLLQYVALRDNAGARTA